MIVIDTANFETQLSSLLELDRMDAAEAGEKQWDCEKSKSLFLEDDVVIVARSDVQVVGFCRVRVHSPLYGVICKIFVHPEYRRQGIGTSLMVNACDYIRNQSCDQAYLGVDAENDAAIALYKKVGFRPTRINMAKNL